MEPIHIPQEFFGRLKASVGEVFVAQHGRAIPPADQPASVGQYSRLGQEHGGVIENTWMLIAVLLGQIVIHVTRNHRCHIGLVVVGDQK